MTLWLATLTDGERVHVATWTAVKHALNRAGYEGWRKEIEPVTDVAQVADRLRYGEAVTIATSSP